MSQPELSIVIPTYNGGRDIREVLTKIYEQKTSVTCEVLVIDSGSTDETPRVVREFPVRLIEIRKRDFSHPRTRNFGCEQATGDLVVFMTQDATPYNHSWLDNLVRPLLGDPGVAASYSRQLPRPHCNPSEMRDIFTGAGPIRQMKVVDPTDDVQKQSFEVHLYEFIRFSNVSACYRKAILRRLPFNESLLMVEDMEWCKRAIEAGYAIIYEPTSVVLHSHDHPLRQVYERHRDYGLSLREFTPLRSTIPAVVLGTLRETILDQFFILSLGMSPLRKLKWALRSPLYRASMKYGLYRGLRDGKASSRA
ncbi:MAG: glycosyltransferase family 2 protein [Candidatus Methylomirabilaceae bacterium]